MVYDMIVRPEYQRAGLTSLPLQHGDAVARAWAVVYLAALLLVSVLPFAVQVAGLLYLAVALALGAWFAAVGVRGWWLRLDARWARRFFFVSLLYLTGLFAALGLDALRV
jgi:protoheme IX farnesyltransferase